MDERDSGIARRILGVRLWLALAFAVVGIASSVSIYLLVSDVSEQAAETESAQLAVGRTVQVAQTLGTIDAGESLSDVPVGAVNAVLDGARTENFTVWAFDFGGLVSRPDVLGTSVKSVGGRRDALALARGGGRSIETDEETGVSVVAVPILRDNRIAGALL